MTHLGYITAAYVIAVVVPLYFSVESLLRTRTAQRRLLVVDPRRKRGVT